MGRQAAGDFYAVVTGSVAVGRLGPGVVGEQFVGWNVSVNGSTTFVLGLPGGRRCLRGPGLRPPSRRTGG